MSGGIAPRAADVTRAPGRGVAALVAWALVAVFLAAVALHLWFWAQAFATYAPHAPVRDVIDPVGLIVPTPFALVGALIVSRRPRQPIGWIMLGTALGMATMSLGSGYAVVAIGGAPGDPPFLGLVADLVSSWAFALSMLLAVVVLPLVYPDGRLPSPRWQPITWGLGLVVLLGTAATTLSEGRLRGMVRPSGQEPVVAYDVANPVSAPWLEPVASFFSVADGPILLALLATALTAVVVRFRRSQGARRQQMKWLAFAVAIVVTTVLITVVEELVRGASSSYGPVFWLGIAGYPIAVGVAVLRYQLYDIDRIISRTVSYGLVVTVLGAVYAAGVVGLGGALSGLTGQEGSDVAVAASVLVVVALFRPVRARVQTAVDRRFNRTGYQARLAVDRFADDLRDEVDLGALSQMTAETAAATVQPDRVSVWLGGREETP